MKKRISLFLVLAMLVTAFGGFSITASAEVPAGYTEISSAEEFVTKIDANPAGAFYLTESITLGSLENPIQTPITKTFNGKLASDETNRKTITMYINDTENPFAGLFSYLGGDTEIKNIELAGKVRATGTSAGEVRSVGALAGKSGSTVTVSNCVNRADVSLEDVTAWGSYAAGFIGNMYVHSNYGTLTNLINKGSISCVSALGGVGGIVGISYRDTDKEITGCENYGTISGKGLTGGIVGNGQKGIVRNCYNAGTVTGSPAGGIFGGDGNIASVTGCYNAGSAANPIGKTTKLIVSDCYYLSSADQNIAGAAFKTKEELKAMPGLPADFTAALDKIVVLPAEYKDYTPIQTPEEFQEITASGKYYLVNDIDLTEMEVSYTPIAEFSGHLVGDAANPPTITMNINDTANANVGLFRMLKGAAVIKNIQLAGSVTASGGALNVGALTGIVGVKDVSPLTAASEIANIVNRADVTASATGEAYVGGLIGNGGPGQLHGKMSGLINYGDVNADNCEGITYVGGISGMFASWGSATVLTGCKNFGTVSGSKTRAAVRVGGISGRVADYRLADSPLAVVNCYNGGRVVGGGMSGGVAGELVSGAELTNCYNTGDVDADVKNTDFVIGGLFGGLANNGTGIKVTNCYNAGTVAGRRDVHPFLGQVELAEVNGDPFKNCGYLSAADFDDSIAGTDPMTLAQMKALENAPQEFIAFLDSIRTVTVETPSNGTLTPSGSAYVNSGSEFSVTAAPDEGYRIASVKANGVALTGNAENVYTTTINGDVTITAEFEQATVVPTIVSPEGGAFALTDGCGSITFGTVSGVGYEIKDYGICYSKTSQEPTEKLSAKAKALVNGQFGVKLLFAPALETGATYYTRPYVTYANADGEEITVYGAMVTTTIE